MGDDVNRRRRRLVPLAAAALVAVAAGVAVGGGEDPAPRDRAARPSATPAPGRAARATAAELAGGAVIMRYAGPCVPAYVRGALREGRAAGVILFADNVPTRARTLAVTRTLRRAGRDRVIVCLDQEGGAVRVLPWAAPDPAQAAQGTPAAARAAAAAAGRDLRRAGVTVTLAPVADVGRPGAAVAGRAFPGGAAAVARTVAAAVRGYAGTGVAPTVKHFPGLGAARTNTDDGPADVDLDARALGATDLPPFRAAIAAGVPAVMVSHARYPALDPDRIASQSRPIVTGLLKGRLGFRGVVMTDSLEARAVGSAADPGAAAVRSVRAGVDLVLTTGPGSHLRVVRALAREARRSPAFRARLADAAGRVRRLR